VTEDCKAGAADKAQTEQAVTEPDVEKWRTDRLRDEYINYGFQYYMLGRCAVAAWANPVAGNQFHHAIEMLLKSGLVPHTTEDERIKLGHRLPRIWKAFKVQYDPSSQLTRFDALVRSLNKYEGIRYPEKTAQRGIMSSFQFGNAAPPPKPSGNKGKAATRNLPTYHLSVGEVDALVKAICQVCRINPKFFTTHFQPPGSTYLKHDNAEDLI
jgi:hypothetical protein